MPDEEVEPGEETVERPVQKHRARADRGGRLEVGIDVTPERRNGEQEPMDGAARINAAMLVSRLRLPGAFVGGSVFTASRLADWSSSCGSAAR
jgi:hypothetical protein